MNPQLRDSLISLILPGQQIGFLQVPDWAPSPPDACTETVVCMGTQDGVFEFLVL